MAELDLNDPEDVLINRIVSIKQYIKEQEKACSVCLSSRLTILGCLREMEDYVHQLAVGIKLRRGGY
uniref:Uncharacterized protein n=1 Tax=viral metagenome TaxID=1070528 RepID=A0A6M3K342_9ZZZZ